MYTAFELNYLRRCLKYTDTIFFRMPDDFSSSHKLPSLVEYQRYEKDQKGKAIVCHYDLQHTGLSNQNDVLKFVEYTVEIEHIVFHFLLQLSANLKSFEKTFKIRSLAKGNMVSQLEGQRDSLSRLLSNWNFGFLKDNMTGSRIEKQVKSCITEYVHQRIDAKLLNLRIAKKYFDYFLMMKNSEKGYLILSRAFEENKAVRIADNRPSTSIWTPSSSTSAKSLLCNTSSTNKSSSFKKLESGSPSSSTKLCTPSIPSVLEIPT